MLTPKQTLAVRAYHWWSEFFVAALEGRAVFLVSTHRQTHLIPRRHS